MNPRLPSRNDRTLNPACAEACPAVAWCEFSEAKAYDQAALVYMTNLACDGIKQAVLNQPDLLDQDSRVRRRAEELLRLLDILEQDDSVAESYIDAAHLMRKRRVATMKNCATGPKVNYETGDYICNSDYPDAKGYTTKNYIRDISKHSDD